METGWKQDGHGKGNAMETVLKQYGNCMEMLRKWCGNVKEMGQKRNEHRTDKLHICVKRVRVCWQLVCPYCYMCVKFHE